MPRYFFDTSALIKNYHVESGTAEVQRLLSEPGAEIFISRLAWVETLSGFATKVRTGLILAQEFQRLRGLFLADVKRKILRPLRVLNSPYQLASDLVTTYGPNRQIRTLDALQLAVALKAHRTQPLDGFVCADQRLCDVAALEGLAVVNPS
ncbi:MAG: hypothetical protein BGO49_04860 [Planctomycetales bacterium 71-10]|nr:MAG: hypothetical protein BGO49_04860 [Planctomycetales bacterium 71-10]